MPFTENSPANPKLPVVMGGRILVVGDDSDVVRLVQGSLQYSGYETRSTPYGDGLVPDIRLFRPDLVLLDFTLSASDAIQVCQHFHKDEHTDVADTAIVVLTARRDQVNRLVDLGVDECVTRPFRVPELISTIRTVLQRRELSKGNPLFAHGGAVVVDGEAHPVHVRGKQVELSVLEFQLLHFLAMHPGKTFSRQQLLERVWRNPNLSLRNVDASISRIREKIEDNPANPTYVLTSYKAGYRFAAANEPEW